MKHIKLFEAFLTKEKNDYTLITINTWDEYKQFIEDYIINNNEYKIAGNGWWDINNANDENLFNNYVSEFGDEFNILLLKDGSYKIYAWFSEANFIVDEKDTYIGIESPEFEKIDYDIKRIIKRKTY